MTPSPSPSPSPSLSIGESSAGNAPSKVHGEPSDGTMLVVGLGGSAGSLTPLRSFFSAQKPDLGMAFIVVVHLSPDHESLLADILQRSTSMRVRQVQERVKVEPNQVYVIPPGRHLAMTDGHLTLLPPTRPRGQNVAIDLFFRTLADAHGEFATAILLSGADHDGAMGIKRIKELGGLTIAQDPNEAEMGEMPRSAIHTGMVDWILAVADIPGRLAAYWTIKPKLGFLEKADRPLPPPPGDDEESALKEILKFVKERTGKDFSDYKRPTVLRRVARRMQVNEVVTLRAYNTFLGTSPGECGALVQDLLVSVTNFFRDREVFASLETFLPKLFEGKTPDDTVRVWVPGCATGEEAYSIAILLNEQAARSSSPPRIQIFATDLDPIAIAAARSGRFSPAISVDVSPERLQQFFTKKDEGYQIFEAIRSQMLFVVHDLLREAPFSRLDLISCRNLLIYLNRDAQSRVFDTFHFALAESGVLLLGSSENAEDASALFEALDEKGRVFRRRDGSRRSLKRALPGLVPTLVSPRSGKVLLPLSLPSGATEPPLQTAPLEITPVELHSRLIEALGPPSLVVNRDHLIVHLSGRVGRFLQWQGGDATPDILQMVPSAVRPDLRAALLHAAQTGSPVELDEMTLAGAPVRLRVQPFGEVADYLLILFLENPVSESSNDKRKPYARPDALVKTLERELTATKEQLRNALDQHVVGMEEMKAANEELLAMNEELRSATEELETGREEMQSINEELHTVNLELKTTVDELARANNDLQTLMASTAIPTVFLDRILTIKRYTPAAVEVFNLIPTDVSRPLSDLRHNLEYPEMLSDAQNVLRTLTPFHREVHGMDDRFFLARITVYQTVNDQTEGVVLTLVDITEQKNAEASLQKALNELEHFSYALTHDMRAPLRAMRSFAELIEEEATAPETRRDYSQRIKKAAERLDRLIADSLHYSTIPRGVSRLEPISLQEFLKDLLDTYPNFHPTVANIVVDPLPAVLGNQACLTQCFANLIGNAVKFAKDGSRAQVRISAGEASSPDAGNYVRIWIRDEGIGIPDQSMTRIFGLFQRATHKHEGTGLGLAIVRKVVSQMEGRVGVVSEEGVGTQFWVELRKVPN